MYAYYVEVPSILISGCNFQFIPPFEFLENFHFFVLAHSAHLWQFVLTYVGGSKSSETSRISPKIHDGIIPKLYRVCNYHYLIWQCWQNDAVRSEVHDVIVWWRHVTVTRSKKRPKLFFLSEVQSPIFMFHVAVIFSRLIWTWRNIIGTKYSLNMQFQFFHLHV